MVIAFGPDYDEEDVSSVMADLGSLGFPAHVAARSMEAVLKELSQQGFKAAKNAVDAASQAIDAYRGLLTPEVEETMFRYLRDHVKDVKQQEKVEAAMNKFLIMAPLLEDLRAAQRGGHYMYWDPVVDNVTSGLSHLKPVEMYRGLIAAAKYLGPSRQSAIAHAVTDWDIVLNKVRQYISENEEKNPDLVNLLDWEARSSYGMVKAFLEFYQNHEFEKKIEEKPWINLRARDDRSLTTFGVVHGGTVSKQLQRIFKQVDDYGIDENGNLGPGKNKIHANSCLSGLTQADRARVVALACEKEGATAETDEGTAGPSNCKRTKQNPV